MWPFRKSLAKRLPRELETIVAYFHQQRDSIESSLLNGDLPHGPSRRQLFKAGAAFDDLLRDMNELGQTISWAQKLSNTTAAENWIFFERLRMALLRDLILSLAPPITRYFEVMPSEDEVEEIVAIGAADEDHTEKKRLNLNLKNILKMAEQLRSDNSKT